MWDYWQALSIIDEWGVDKFAELSANLHNSLMMAVAKKGGKIENKDLRRPAEYERKFRWERKRQRVMSGEMQLTILKGLCGL